MDETRKQLILRRGRIKVAAWIVMLICFANTVAFFYGGYRLGGDASGGKIEAGRYYVGNHGRFTEVTPAQFKYSRIHGWSVLITHPLALGAMFTFMLTCRREQKEAAARSL